MIGLRPHSVRVHMLCPADHQEKQTTLELLAEYERAMLLMLQVVALLSNLHRICIETLKA